ncbi:geranylgeranyl pyrophosphate synthase [Aspergillus sclerotioniger CBS 115572]|uniref:Geranylgeranyl pyrophosphate synthase n=1 Tax=Aspergillus sclerotioniger CBS 115572 TaxID=1450535 RepID=A0A317V4G2_9EURO|nr:geranylgeranyl pyrophosphate synthase [Aspergillus sclerotioniger CBS 115572]PWY67090.1 geranylgeranyl pyrophosphate synthase [Aspergillus sclerotioniger CBS 115572]
MAQIEAPLDTSYPVPRASGEIHGFCDAYPLRRHKFEDAANDGSLQCRADWETYIGPTERWGCGNPWEGHFAAVVLPFCRPDRIAVISYIFEYAFLYDSVVESVERSTLNINADDIALDETEYRTVRSITGTKQIQSKMLLELLSIDPQCAEVVIDAWKTMISTTAKQDKTRTFSNLEDYVNYRIIDTGAPHRFVDTLMRFGMDINLTPDEEELVAPIVKPCYAALGLANDYFSFDVEWGEFQKEDSDRKAMTNAVWLFMQWHHVDEQEAKRCVQQVTNEYEKEYQQRVHGFLSGHGKENAKLHTYLSALGYQIPGNVSWSLRCPRYHPWLCGEASAILQDSTGETQNLKRRSISGESDTSQSSVWSDAGDSSPRSSISSAPSMDVSKLSDRAHLGSERLMSPAEYISSLPSKGVREAFIDALNVWLVLPYNHVNVLKSIAKTLHNASLMLDDIEDSSPLRRGQPATHTIFGEGPTINSANFLLIQAMDQVRQLEDPACLDIFVEDMRNLFIGQSHDLYWTQQGECPAEDEYMEMIRQKTGGLFRLLARLMMQKAPAQQNRNISLDPLINLLGEYFQIRDDYKNLTEEYTGQKGFCEDLDEGKFSFPLIHALRSHPEDLELREILQRARESGGLDVSSKQCVLDHFHQNGSMEYTQQTLRDLMEEIKDRIGQVEKEAGSSNWVLRLLVHRLEV